MTFKPKIGDATSALLSLQKEKLKPEEIERLKVESLEILSKCNPPGEKKKKAGLIIGYVQSGKTLSLTTVSALARDNGYGMIIVMCGVSNVLFAQNSDRLNNELVVQMPATKFFTHVNGKAYKADKICAVLKEWSSDKENPVLIITVLKHQKNISKLTEAINKAFDGLRGQVPAIIIDDEAHMAGLNTKAKNEGEESAVYASIKGLRNSITDHTYLQYTATPQAPLLVQIADSVSPDFAQILTPGSAYIGGKDIFPERNSVNFLRTIPECELPSFDGSDPDKDTAPETLGTALLTFLVGLSDGIAKREHLTKNRNRTMLVHPGMKTESHDAYAGYIKALLRKYSDNFDGPYRQEEGHNQLIDKIKECYNDLKSTYPSISDLSVILKNFASAINNADGQISKLNKNKPKENKVNWEDYAHILIGGEVLGVGFTVEGLTVTYMPREATGGQADSMQQRARFLGYRASYVGLIRIFISEDDQELYSVYSVGEEFNRKELKEMNAENKTLKEWRRKFLVGATQKLTRANIQSYETQSDKLDKRCYPRAPYVGDLANNRSVLADIRSRFSFQTDSRYKESWRERNKHDSVIITMSEALEILLNFSWTDEIDSRRWSMINLILRGLNEMGEAGETCRLMHMSPLAPRSREIKEKADGTLDWVSVFQSSDSGTSYPGDRALEDSKRLTIQIYDFDMYTESRSARYDSVIVPVVIPTDEMLNTIKVIRNKT